MQAGSELSEGLGVERYPNEVEEVIELWPK